MEREKEASNGDWKLNFKEFYSLILTSYLGAPIDIHFQSNEHRPVMFANFLENVKGLNG